MPSDPEVKTGALREPAGNGPSVRRGRAWYLLGALLLACGDADPELPESLTHGFVRDSESGAGISGARVIFATVELDRGQGEFDVLEQFRIDTFEEPRGYYSLQSSAPSGWYRIEVSAQGYENAVHYRHHDYTALCDDLLCGAQNFALVAKGTLHTKLPDLISDPRRLAEYELSSTCDGRDEVSMCLRLPIGTANVGEGDLWLTAPKDDLTNVSQRLFDTESNVEAVPLEEARFIHHEGHGHLHFDGWSELTMRRIDATCDAEATAEKCAPIRAGEKLSFCLRDSRTVDDAFEPDQDYECTIDAGGLVTQGIGAGKMDLYKRDLLGQMFDVTGLENGDYWVESNVNPHELVHESDYSNNVSRSRVRLELPPCGDGRIDYPESCEGTDLAGLTCKTLSTKFTGGTLKCSDSCGFDRSGCERAECSPIDLGSKLGDGVAMGTNRGAFNAMDTYLCERPRGSGEDLAFRWTAPVAGSYQFDTSGSDYETILFVLDGDCTGKELACDIRKSTSKVTVALDEAQGVVVVVDAHPGQVGRYVLNVTQK